MMLLDISTESTVTGSNVRVVESNHMLVFNGDLEHKKDPRGYKATMDPNCSQT